MLYELIIKIKKNKNWKDKIFYLIQHKLQVVLCKNKNKQKLKTITFKRIHGKKHKNIIIIDG